MILIQRVIKIKGQKWLKDFILDLVFYLIFFIFGASFVFLRMEKGTDIQIVSENLVSDSIKEEPEQNPTEKIEDSHIFVASSRGKYFYKIGSNRANSLSDKNKIYFSSVEEAEKLGFKPYFGD